MSKSTCRSVSLLSFAIISYNAISQALPIKMTVNKYNELNSNIHRSGNSKKEGQYPENSVVDKYG